MAGKSKTGIVIPGNSFKHLSKYQEFIKLILDYFVAVVSLMILSPVILILVILIRLSGRGPLFYSQDRLGKDGKPFLIYKFRSMVHDAEYHEPKLSHGKEERVTGVGRIMRKYRLDEIPNFINVLKGEMSVVGPRPERQFFVEKIIRKAPYYPLVHKVRPGITSYGQVKFGYATTVEEMIERLDYDIYYMKNRSLLFDLKIMFMTIKVVLKGKGV
jgi:lipopolysaccharide/colanic/teichoic acid biosynthesis glycosyltransferase